MVKPWFRNVTIAFLGFLLTVIPNPRLNQTHAFKANAPEDNTNIGGQTQAPPQPSASTTNSNALSNDVPYRCVLLITGLDETTRQDLFDALRGKPWLCQRHMACSLQALTYRASQDCIRLSEALRTKGYLSPVVKSVVQEDQDDPSSYVVIFKIKPGILFRFDKIKIATDFFCSLRWQHFLSLMPDTQDLLGKPANVEAIEKLHNDVINYCRQYSFLGAKIVRKKMIVHHQRGTVSLSIKLDPGPFVSFGPTTIEGTQNIDAALIPEYFLWEEGQPYDQQKVDNTLKALQRTELFQSTEIQAAVQPSQNTRQPFCLKVHEQPQRLIEYRVSYAQAQATQQPGNGLTRFKSGIETAAKWTHFDLFGNADRLQILFSFGLLKQELEGILRLFPDKKTGSEWQNEVSMLREKEMPYQRKRLLLRTAYVLPLRPWLSLQTGLSCQKTDISEGRRTGSYHLVQFLIKSNMDFVDNQLDPCDGLRLQTKIDPGLCLQQKGAQALTLVAQKCTGYRSVFGKKVVSACWVEYQSLRGSVQQGIPIDQLLYAGGVDSVRGYVRQMAGDVAFQKTLPIDHKLSGWVPIGGRHLWHAGSEVRFPVYGDVGGVVFYEGARLIGQHFYRGYGIGFRYPTPMGPLRLDIGRPVKVRKKIDATFQVYFGLGQAF